MDSCCEGFLSDLLSLGSYQESSTARAPELAMLAPCHTSDRRLPGFTLERLGGWPALAARAPGADRCGLSRCGGLRGGLARRRRRGPEGLSAAGGAQARNAPRTARPCDRRELRRIPVSASVARRSPRSAASRAWRAPRALEAVEKALTVRHGTTCAVPLDAWHFGFA